MVFGVSLVNTEPALAAVLERLPRLGDLAVVRDGEATVIAIEGAEIISADGEAALEALDHLTPGWWAGFLSYDLGRAVESVPDCSPHDPPLPDLRLVRYGARLRCDPAGLTIEGESAAARRGLERLLEGAPTSSLSPGLHDWRSSLDRTAWEAAVQIVLEHLRAGDCYQVNLTRRLEAEHEAEPVALFAALAERNPAPHAALVRCGDVAVVSASPERFLLRQGNRIETRPIKGTASRSDALVASQKDRAENVMIVDLARNDLGRVCEYGTVHVPLLCALEEHPGLFHLVSTVAGTLRADAGVGEIIRATFPPASVTGCPKPRVLEIIETLEPVRRGAYCGAVGFIDTERDVMDLNVAIRTFTITNGRTYFGVGAGIVADSDPSAEWEETELKARRLLAVCAAG